MEWTNENILEFISSYESEPILWNPSEPGHKKKELTYDAWQRIRRNLSWSCSVDDLKKKRDSLMAYYRQHLRMIKKKLSESGETKEIYNVNWFAFSSMHSFLQHALISNSQTYEDEDQGNTSDTDITTTNITNQTDQQSINQVISQDTVPTLCINQDNAQSFCRKRKINNLYTDNNIINTRTRNFEDSNFIQQDDEYETFGKLIAIKIRKLKNSNAKEVLMNDIHNMVFRACIEDNMNENVELSLSQSFNQNVNGQEYQIPESPGSPETKPLIAGISTFYQPSQSSQSLSSPKMTTTQTQT